MQIVLGPVLTRKGGYAFDCWTPEKGLSRGYIYGRIEDAHYARKIEIRSRNKGSSDQPIACSTADDFVRLTPVGPGLPCSPMATGEERRAISWCSREI